MSSNRSRVRGPRTTRTGPPESAPERLQKVLASAGVASRRASEELIAAGRVRVDGRVVTTLGARVSVTAARIEVDGRRIAVDPAREYWVLNKPAGVVTTARDPQKRPTVLDLVPTEVRVFPVGRLDAQTQGLVLLTNDGELANRLTHPRFGVRRTYLAEVEGLVEQKTLRRLTRGVSLEDGPARATEARVVRQAQARSHVEMTLTEGRKREVRRMLAAVGHPVRALSRIAFGPLSLGTLRAGRARRLRPEEVGDLLRSAGL